MAISHDITIDQGATYVEEFTVETLTNQFLPYDAETNPYVPLDISNAEIRMNVRATYDSSSVVFTATATNGKFVKTSDNSFKLEVEPEDSTAIRFTGEEGTFVYDIEAVLPDLRVLRIVQGSFIVSREVTR